MAVPDFQSLMLPVLRQAANGPTTIKEARTQIAAELNLSPDDLSELIPSEKKTRFADRIDWAKTYLKQAGLVTQPKRGVFVITDVGKTVLAGNPAKIDINFLTKFESFNEFRSKHLAKTENSVPLSASPQAPISEALTPGDQIDQAMAALSTSLKGDLIEEFVDLSPAAFERVIIDLMLAMGYGGSRADAAKHLGGSGDGGVDGVIREDPLGLDVIYLQAKRYAPNAGIGPEKVQAFSGALDQKGARKGVFVTTSYFTEAAKLYVAAIQTKKIVLIDGDELASLMMKHNLGVKVDRAIEVKVLDPEYFEDV